MRLLLVMTVAMVMVGCGRRKQDANTINLGAVIDRTGNNSEPSWADAIKLAFEHANAGIQNASQFEGVKFKLLLADSANEPALALSRATDLVRQQNAKALITDTSQVDLEINKTFYDTDTANDLGVPVQCGSCTSGTVNNPVATDPDSINQAALRNSLRWNFRSIMSTKLISQILVKLMIQNAEGDVNGDSKFKISYIASDEVFGRGAIKDLKTYAASMHPTPAPIIEEIYHARDADPNSFNWADAARQLADNQTSGSTDGAPDALVIANFAQQQAAFVKAYKQGGYGIRLLHYHTFRISSAIQALGGLGDGEEGVSHVNLDGASGDIFAKEYEDRYGIPVVYRDSVYYDNAMTLLLATVIASSTLDDPTQVTGQQIRDAISKTSTPGGEIVRSGPDEFARAVGIILEGKGINYEGASGPMDYDANGNILQRLAQYRVQNGQFVDVAKFDCVTDTLCPLMSAQ